MRSVYQEISNSIDLHTFGKETFEKTNVYNYHEIIFRFTVISM